MGLAGLGVWVALDPRPHSFVLAPLLGLLGYLLARGGGQAAAAESAESAGAAGASGRDDDASGVLRSEAWLDMLLGQMPVGLWTTDLQLEIASVEGTGIPLPGRQRRDPVGAGLQELLRTADVEHPAMAAHRAALSGETVNLDLRVRHQVHHVTVGPLRDHEGEIRGVVGLALGVADRAREDEVLRSLVSGIATKTGNECLSSLVRHLGLRLGVRHVAVLEFSKSSEHAHSVAAWSSDGQVPELSQALIGSICQGLGPREIRHVQDGARNRFPEDPHLQRLEAEGAYAIGLAGPEGATGALVIVDSAPLAARDLERASASLFAERAAAELERERVVQALKLSEQRYRLMAENLPGLIYLARQEEGSSIEYLGGSVQELTGYEAERFLTGELSLQGLCHPEDAENVLEERRKAILQGSSFHLRFRLRHADGSWRWVEEMGVGVAMGAADRLVEGFLWDVTRQQQVAEERSLYRDQVLQGQKAESLGVLAGGLAYEFNNLLTTVLGNVDLLKQHLGGVVIPGLQDIQRAALRGGELARHMLDYAGQGSYSFQTLEPSRFLDGIRELLQVTAGERVELRIEAEEGLPVISGDPIQLRHVCRGLIENAVEALQAAGRSDGLVTLRIRHLSVEEHRELEGGICIEISDNGPGLTEEEQARVFEPFFSARFTGRGLGLAAAEGVLRAHSGRIQVRSEVGEGATFLVFLPAAPQGVSGDQRVQDGGEDLDSESGEPVVELMPNVLVVDGEQMVRSLAQSALGRAGYRVATAADCQGALELLRERETRFELALVDTSAPDLELDEHLRELKRQHPDLPIVLSSGYRPRQSMEQDGHVRAFLGKPYRPSQLVETVQRILEEGDRESGTT